MLANTCVQCIKCGFHVQEGKLPEDVAAHVGVKNILVVSLILISTGLCAIVPVLCMSICTCTYVMCYSPGTLIDIRY